MSIHKKDPAFYNQDYVEEKTATYEALMNLARNTDDNTTEDRSWLLSRISDISGKYAVLLAAIVPNERLVSELLSRTREWAEELDTVHNEAVTLRQMKPVSSAGAGGIAGRAQFGSKNIEGGVKLSKTARRALGPDATRAAEESLAWMFKRGKAGSAKRRASIATALEVMTAIESGAKADASDAERIRFNDIKTLIMQQ